MGEDIDGLRERLERKAKCFAGEPMLINPDGPEASAAVAQLQAENERMGGALTRISVGQPMTMMDGSVLMVCLRGTDAQEIANVALAALNPKDQSND